MRNLLFFAALTLSFITLTADLVHAQQIGATALPLSTTRIGLVGLLVGDMSAGSFDAEAGFSRQLATSKITLFLGFR